MSEQQESLGMNADQKLNNEGAEDQELVPGNKGFAADEIRAVMPPSSEGSVAYALLALVLLVVLIGGAYYLVNGGFPSLNPQAADPADVQLAKRYPIDKNVTVEVVAEQQVATAQAAPVPHPEPVVSADSAALAPQVVVAKSVQNDSEQAAAEEKKVAVSATQKQQMDVVPAVVPVEPKKVVVLAPTEPEYQVVVGPYLSKTRSETAEKDLREQGYKVSMSKGRGMVTMTRLLEGIYPAGEARKKVAALQVKVKDAFLLPAGEKRAIYVGSFADAERAASYAESLTAKGVHVTLVSSDLEMNGRILTIDQADQKTAAKLAAKLNAAGYNTEVKKK